MSTVSVADRVLAGIGVGVAVLDASSQVVVWNGFMEKHSGRSSAEVVGRSIYEVCEYLPRVWLQVRLRSVQMLKAYSFTSWKQRPYLFEFKHNRPITGGPEYMFQDCVFMPIEGDDGKTWVCIVVQDATDVALFQKQLEELTEVNASLEQLSFTDALTGVFNRRYVLTHLESVFAEATRYGRPFSLLLLDLDHFKKVNDTHGHLAGDEVLKATSRQVVKALRGSDVFGRYGGEEFVAVLPETDSEGAMMLAERLRLVIAAQSIQAGGAELRITASLGVSTFAAGVKDARTVLDQTDQALYRSKSTGRNRCTLFPPNGSFD